MQRDSGIAETVGALILIVIIVVGAGIVLSVVMDKPSPNLPVLDYESCNLINEVSGASSLCIRHEGGATLYVGQHYVNGLFEGEIVPESPFYPSVPFSLGELICLENIDTIQLIVIDESGHTLHGTRYPRIGLLCSQIGSPPPSPTGSPTPSVIPELEEPCVDRDDCIELQGLISGHRTGDRLRFIDETSGTLLREVVYPNFVFTTRYCFSGVSGYTNGNIRIDLVRDGVVSAYAVAEECPIPCPPGYILNPTSGECEPRPVTINACREVDADVARVTGCSGCEPDIDYEIELIGILMDGSPAPAQPRIPATFPFVDSFKANPFMSIQKINVHFYDVLAEPPKWVIVGPGDTLPRCANPSITACVLRSPPGGRSVQVSNAGNVKVFDGATWKIKTKDSEISISQGITPLTGPWDITVSDMITDITLVQFGQEEASTGDPTLPCEPCDPLTEVWNPITKQCECIPGYILNENGVCEIAPVEIAPCWSMNPHRQIDIELRNIASGVQYQILVNNVDRGLYRPGNDGKMRITLTSGTIERVEVRFNGQAVPLIFNGGLLINNVLLSNRENIPDCLTGTCVDEYVNTEDKNKDWANGCRCIVRSVPAVAIVKNPAGGDYDCSRPGTPPAGVFCPSLTQEVNIETKADGSCDCEIGYDRVPPTPLTALITACKVRLPDWGQPYCSGGSNNKGVQFYGTDDSPGVLYEIQFTDAHGTVTGIHVAGTRTLLGVGAAPDSIAAYLCTDAQTQQINYGGGLFSYGCRNKIGPIVYGGKGNINQCTPASAGVTSTCKADNILPGTGGNAYYGMTVPAHFNVGSSNFQQSCGGGNGCVCDYGYTDAGNTCTLITFSKVEYCYATEDRGAIELILPKTELNLVQNYCPPPGTSANIPYRVNIGVQNQIPYYAGSPQTFSVTEREGKNIQVRINLYRPVYVNNLAIPAANKIENYCTATMHPSGVPTSQHIANSVNPVVFNSMATWDGVRYCGCVGEDDKGPCNYSEWIKFQQWVEDCKKTQDYLDGKSLCNYSEYKNR